MIENYESCGWLKACDSLKEHRENQLPIKMNVTLNFSYRPDHGLEYL